MSSCGVCGHANPDPARFCLSCGTALVDGGVPGAVGVPGFGRRTVTVVFADVVGSTAPAGLGEGAAAGRTA